METFKRVRPFVVSFHSSSPFNRWTRRSDACEATQVIRPIGTSTLLKQPNRGLGSLALVFLGDHMDHDHSRYFECLIVALWRSLSAVPPLMEVLAKQELMRDFAT